MATDLGSERPDAAPGGDGPTVRQHVSRPGERTLERAAYLGYRTAEVVIGALPRRLVLPVAAAAGNAAYDLAGSKADLIRANMAQVLGLPADHSSVSRAARHAFQNYGQYLAEVMRLPTLTPARVRQMVTFHGWEQLAAAQGSSETGLLLCAVHVGAMDLLGSAMTHEGEPVHVVADDTTYGQLYDHLRRVREAHGIQLIGWRRLRGLYRVLKSGGNLVLMCDGAYRPGDVPVSFLGAATTFPPGPALLSARTGAAILPIDARRAGLARFDVWGFPVIRAADSGPAEIHRATQELANAMGSVIARDPGQWYMFRPVWPQTEAERRAAEVALERARRGEDWTTA